MENLQHRLQKRINVSLYALVFLTGLLGLSLILEGCSDTCETKNEYVYFEPVYTSLEEIRSSVELIDPQPVHATGKIYLRGSWLFVNEPGKGIHVIDNANPEAPVVKSFINIPGNYELAVKGNILYADSYIDLVAIDITDINNITEKTRLENVFSNYNTPGIYLDVSKGLITDWVEKKEVKVYESDCDANVQAWGGFYYRDGVAVLASEAFDWSSANNPGNGSVPGLGGSMARFTISANHLYALDGSAIQPIDITDPTSPIALSKKEISWDMETIFPYEDKLFIGSMTGMHILDISSPAVPSLISTYAHVRVCDPVVVRDDIAYVTLRSGTECLGFTNQLEVIDITDVTNPTLLSVHAMTNPHGLGIDDNTLFICDGDDGLKVYDASEHMMISERLLAHYGDINAFDVIPYNNVLIMIGADGIYQYDYSDPQNVRQLSKIAVQREGV
jgi:hypothetical protein